MIDNETFEKLYNQHKQKVYNLCLRMMRRPDLAEDMMQDTFIQVAKTYHQWRGDSKFTSWLYRVATTTCLMYFRSPKNTKEIPSLVDYLPEKTIDNSLIDRIVLQEAFTNLASGYCAVLYLHDVLGMNYQEIGRLLGISEGTVKSQLWKAKRRIWESLGKGERKSHERETETTDL